MQFRRPTSNPGSAPHSQGSFVGKPTGRPDWLKEWIADKGKWAQLACGNKVDLNDRGQILLCGEKKGDLLAICERCWQFCAVERRLSFLEFKGIPTAVIPDEPLF